MHAERSNAARMLGEWRVPASDPSGFGEPLTRREDARLLAGAGRFVADLPLSGCLSMVFVRSPMARASIRALRLGAARASPNVVRIYTGDDLGRLTPPRANPVMGEVPASDLPVLARSELHCVGQPLAAVVAESEAAALEAADRVELDLDSHEPVCDAQAALGAAPFFPESTDNVVVDKRWRNGDPEGGFTDAALVSEVTIRHPRVAAAPLECRATAARWDGETGHLTVWTGTQTPHRARDDIARALAIRPERVRAVAPDVGGAFGMKASIYPEDLAVAFAARDLQRPVRWTAGRQEDFLAASHGRGALTSGRMAFDASGRILALETELIFPLGAWLTFSAIVPAWNATRILPGPYAVENVDVRVRAVLTNTAPVGIYRGAGRPEAAMLLERLLDSGARTLGLDPASLRRRNLVPAEALPLARPNGTVLDSGNYSELLSKTMEQADYGNARRRQSRRRNRNELVGLGWSLYVEPCGRGWESASIALEKGGRFTVATGSSSQGQGRETTFAQIAARELAVTCDLITVVQGDTMTAPSGVGALASRSVAIGGSAVQQAARKMIEMACPLAARLLNASSPSIVLTVRGFCLSGSGKRSVSWGRIAETAGGALHASATYTADGEAWGSGCCLAEVSVDRSTGEVRLERFHHVDDIGTVVNPRLVEGQIAGGIAQGIGQTLLEDIVYDADGQLLAGSLMDYALPRAADQPDLRLDRMATPSPFNTLGAKGVGEAGTIGAPPAIVNAVLDALAPLGVGHVDLPLTPERVWRAIQSARDTSQPAESQP